MRVSENTILQDFLRNIEDSRRRWFDLSNQVSSGKRITTPADDPAGSARLLRVKDEFSRINQYMRNISGAQSKLGIASSALNTLRNLVSSVGEKASFALTGTTSQDGRNSIALELRGILENVEQVAASSVDGQYIFSGTKVDTPPLTTVDGEYVYQGDQGDLKFEITQGEKIAVNVNGAEVFADPDADLVNSLRQLIDSLEAGDVDQAMVHLSHVQDAGKSIDSARFKLSKSINQADSAEQRLNDRLFTLTEEVSALEDTDMADAISRMTQAETALKASLSVGARTQQGNLFDYIG